MCDPDIAHVSTKFNLTADAGFLSVHNIHKVGSKCTKACNLTDGYLLAKFPCRIKQHLPEVNNDRDFHEENSQEENKKVEHHKMFIEQF